MNESAALDLVGFASEVGGVASGPVTISGTGTRGGACVGVRAVRAPSGVQWIQADEMIVACGAATTVAELDLALAPHRQQVALPVSGTVGGALAAGLADVRRLGYGHPRDVLLQAHYVSAAGDVVKAGGPTVKNVSGFDLCRLLVGSRGTLGFLAAVLLRTRPRPPSSQWFDSSGDPWAIASRLHHPTSVLWDGVTTWVLLEGHPEDIDDQASRAELSPCDGPPTLPEGNRWSMSASGLRSMVGSTGFVAEIGVGVVHHSLPAPSRRLTGPAAALHARLKHEFDPTMRLNPTIDILGD